ncbi:MAG: glycosyltransferase family 2 protein [Candidatus Entotheonellia bacterium]
MNPALELAPGERLEILSGAWRSHPEVTSAFLQDISGCHVTVVIVTRGRPELQQAIESICRQDFAGPIRLLVVGDDCQELPADFPAPAHVRPDVCNLQSVKLSRERNPYRRVARLRNVASRLVTTRFLCFLDDDNLWEEEHLSTLMRLIQQTRLLAVHSWRRLVNRDGQPVTPDRYLWLPPGPQADQLFSLYCEHGVMDPTDSVVRDRPTLRIGDQNYGMVDMGEWLFDRQLFSVVQFNEEGPSGKQQLHSGEDDKLLHEMHRLAIPVACTEQPTLLYRLGGFSNDFTQ